MRLRGSALLKDAVLNKGTAFSPEERHDFGLEGLLPYAVESLGQQLTRVRLEYDSKRTDLGRHIFLRQLQDASRVLFYRFVVECLEELLPIVYIPTVGEACQKFSRIYRRPHGLFVAYPDIDHLDEMLDNAAPTDLRIIVVSDGERILGLGDQGVGGMGIPVGKLALYTACGGIHPNGTLPVFLDVGTNNPALLGDPLYLGWRHERVVGEDYDRFVDTFVQAVRRRFPNVLLQWEDFAQHHATALLERYRARICSFNDDIQGTAAVALAAVLAGARNTGSRVADQRVVIVGAGSAGSGIGVALMRAMIAQGLGEERARQRIFLVDRDGLVHDGMPDLPTYQRPLAQPAGAVARWSREGGDPTALPDVVEHVAPTVLIGVSGQPGLFTESIIRQMASRAERPMILPLSNPTSRAEAMPEQILAWTDGRALVATGSPFEGIAQANNVHVFPGLGLGVLAAQAPTVTDGMLDAAAGAIAALAPSTAVLPPLSEVRATSRSVALAVGLSAVADGVAPIADEATLSGQIASLVWEPHYSATTLPDNSKEEGNRGA